MGRRLLKFQADWCAPCHALDPLVEQLAKYHDLELARVDVDADPAMAASFEVRGLPTLVLMEDGVELARTTGARVIGALERELGLKALERAT